jgi:oligoribonuclease NrnB/cAMP/cGMP phosphodiesterase (DHH superfamily)
VKIFVLYHANCQDGFGAAWAARDFFGDSATYIPVQYGDPLPEMPDGSAVYIVDFSYDRATLEALSTRVEKLVVLDHHKTAKAELDGLPFATFDMNKSGAVLTWEYFNPGEPPPALLLYIQDRDLWRWKLPDSREISAALTLEPRDFRHWDRLVCDVYDPDEHPAAWEKVVNIGRTVLESLAIHVASIADNEVWSLRSRNGFDVSAVAKQLGGGGHPAAAGFKVRRSSKDSSSRSNHV